ncbi:hypothetical protein ES703_66935 [subsurface metagenome]
MAFWAGTLRAVERKKIGEGVIVDNSTCLALKLIRKHKLFMSSCMNFDFPLSFFQANLQGIHQSFSVFSVQSHPVNKDIKAFVLFKLGFFEIDDFIFLNDAEKAVFLKNYQSFFQRPGEGNPYFYLGRQAIKFLDDRIDCISVYRLAALEAVNDSYSGVEYS